MYFTKIDVHLKKVNHPERKSNWDFMPSCTEPIGSEICSTIWLTLSSCRINLDRFHDLLNCATRFDFLSF